MSRPFLRLTCILLFLSGMMYACKKPVSMPEEPTPNGHSVTADTISNHLRFVNAVKKQGAIPKGPATSSLKISFQDTLYLVDKWKIPVKFLHEDTTKNVAGAFIQVHASTGATFYYDVPELPDIASNDSVSVILIGIDPRGLIDTSGVPSAGAPFNFEIAIVPHDSKGQPLGQVTSPAQVPGENENGTGSCGIVTRPGEYWEWSMSFITDPTSSTGENIFFNSPNKLWGLEGQDIQGCCTNGVSSYTSNCAVENQRRLNFQTFFNWPNEIYKFFEDGTYSGLTEYLSADPAPQGSDFCSTGSGVVQEDFDRSFLEGTWTVDASSFLTTLGTSTPQAGSLAARPLGIIDMVTCRLLIIVKPSQEGGSRDLVNFYIRQNSSSPHWYPI